MCVESKLEELRGRKVRKVMSFNFDLFRQFVVKVEKMCYQDFYFDKIFFFNDKMAPQVIFFFNLFSRIVSSLSLLNFSRGQGLIPLIFLGDIPPSPPFLKPPLRSGIDLFIVYSIES